MANPLIQHKPIKSQSWHLKVEELGSGVEKYYFFILNHLRREPPYGFGFGESTAVPGKKEGDIYKIKDIYASTETSSYWGSIEQRKAAQQERASQYLATVGRMVKDLFQITRELRITDERLQYYSDSYKGDESAEMALKGIWIDMVEGGSKQPTSVLGMAAQVGFVILPDLFFKVKPIKSEEVDSEVEKLKESGINRKVREVLKRKLKQFYIWKERTYKEITTSKNFKLKYLRQHYNVIKMYMGWIRPYLRNIRKLQQQYATGLYESPDLVTAFETAEIEVELLGKRKIYEFETDVGGAMEKEFKKYFPCVLIKFKYVTIPQMAYQQEFQRGAIHVGRTEITTEAYVLTQEQIDEYIKKQDEEDMELLSSVNTAMEALGEELKHYLEEAGEVMEKEKEEKPKGGFIRSLFFPKPEKKPKETIFEPFKALFSGIGEILGTVVKIPEAKKKEKIPKGEKAIAEEEAAKLAYIPYVVTKKAFGMITE